MVVLRVVRWGCLWFLFGEYIKEFVIFRGNWFLACSGCLFDFVDYYLAYLPWVCFADFPVLFFFCWCFLVVLFCGFSFWDCVGSW